MKIVALLSKKIKHGFLVYISGLILNPEKKSCAKIASFFGLNHDFLYRFLSTTKLLIPIFPRLMFAMANYFAQTKKGYLIVDDTTMSKPFARFIVGIWDIYNTSLKRSDRGLIIVVIVWSNGLVTIPLKFEYAFQKDVVGDKYCTKSVLAQKLIVDCKQNVQFRYLLGDGHYSTKYLLNFVAESNLQYTGKIAKNRVVETSDGVREQLKNHPGLKLLRNERSKKIRAQYAGHWFYFSVHKRKNRSGDFTYVYFVSTLDVNPKKYLEMYAGRWSIESTFRTMKQHLGFAQCQSRDLDRQRVHLLSIFFSYGFLESIKTEQSLKNPEEAIKLLRKLKSRQTMQRIASFSGNFQCSA